VTSDEAKPAPAARPASGAPDGRAGLSHLTWIPAGALVGFAAAFVFGDVVELPADLYYALYFASVLGFLGVYVRTTALPLRQWLSRRVGPALLAGVAVGLLMAWSVLARPATEALSGAALAWAVLWRGLLYGAVDGLLLFAFPWTVTWRALGAEGRGPATKVGASALAWAAILFVTTVYHLGYGDFRSRKVVQPNVGNAITALATLSTANPLASAISHVFLHVAAVVHSPGTDLFLPPHRSR
jgi:hypothetical protein